MKLQDLTIVYICPDHDEKYHTRKLHVESLLKSIGCKTVIHYKSGVENYPACLTAAIVEILESHMNNPVLILEDDVEFVVIKLVTVAFVVFKLFAKRVSLLAMIIVEVEFVFGSNIK